METLEVHNSFTLYGANKNGTESEQKLMAAAERPQDWGHPRWHFDQVTLDWISDNIHYIHHVYMWTDVKRENSLEYLKLFAGVIIYIMLPGMAPQLCGREYLAEEDFWSKKWGKMPPTWEKLEDSYEQDFDESDD